MYFTECKNIHDEQNANILSKDRINIIDFSLCLRLQYAPYSTAAVQSSFNILVFCHHRLFLHFDFCKYGLEILFILISEIWGSALNFVTKGSASLSPLASSWSPLSFYCSSVRVQTPPVSPLLLLGGEKGPRSWCL